MRAWLGLVLNGYFLVTHNLPIPCINGPAVAYCNVFPAPGRQSLLRAVVRHSMVVFRHSMVVARHAAIFAWQNPPSGATPCGVGGQRRLPRHGGQRTYFHATEELRYSVH